MRILWKKNQNTDEQMLHYIKASLTMHNLHRWNGRAENKLVKVNDTSFYKTQRIII